MEYIELENYLKSLGTDDSLTTNLSARKREELEFHNRDRDIDNRNKQSRKEFEYYQGNEKYYSTTTLSTKHISKWIKDNAKGKIFLDYACGNGLNAIAAAKEGAKLAIGLDLSDVSISNCRRHAAEEGVGATTVFYQGDCEKTRLPDDSVDAIICSGMLHHLDLNHAFPELRRILKPGGRILVVEALNYNPIIKLYRLITPQMRTDWEKKHILSFKDVRLAKSFFSVQDIRYWHLMSILATPFRNNVSFNTLLHFFNGLDQLILKIPVLRLMAWQYTFELIKEVRK